MQTERNNTAIRIQDACKSNAIQIQKQCGYRTMAMRLRYERITDARRVRYHFKTTTKPKQYITHTNAILTQYGYTCERIRISNKDKTNTMRHTNTILTHAS